MSFLDRFRRQHVSQSGPELRDALIAVVAAKDTPAFTPTRCALRARTRLNGLKVRCIES